VIRVSLVGVRVEVPTNQPMVLLREEEGTRYLPIFIGPPEATAIVYALQGLDTPRPMTHDLFTTVFAETGVVLEQVVITDLDDGTFFAEVTLRRDEERWEISARPSDAIALAVRQPEPVPIFVDDDVMDEAGVLFDQEQEEEQIEEFREFIDQVRPEDFAQ